MSRTQASVLSSPSELKDGSDRFEREATRMGEDSAVSSVWAERGRAARSWRTCEMPPRTWSLGMGCLSVCVKFQVKSYVTKRVKSNSDENPTENLQGPRGARLHVTYGSMAGEATANLLHVLLCLWDILVSEPE